MRSQGSLCGLFVCKSLEGITVMMKLKHLEDNRELAYEILNHWELKNPNLEIMDQYRISATAIYPYKDQDEVRLLRFTPEDERQIADIKAELEFIEYLRNHNFDVAHTVSSNNGNEIENLTTKWGTYTASVFKRVKGQRVDGIKLTEGLLSSLGETLAQLHNLSENFVPRISKRQSYVDKLEWMEILFDRYEKDGIVSNALNELRKQLGTFSKDSHDFGLIHYDYDLDNLFYDEESKHISVIDFDDSVYHWYVMDVINFYDCISDEFEGEALNNAMSSFNKGYEQHRIINVELMKKRSTFELYEALYSYAGCLHSVKGMADYPPEWMITLKERFENAMANKKSRM